MPGYTEYVLAEENIWYRAAVAVRKRLPNVFIQDDPGNAFPSGYPQRGRSATLALPEF